MVRLERIEPSLYPRTWSLNREPDKQVRQLLLLTDGAGEAEVGETRLSVEAPAVAWLVDGAQGRLRVEAGATGFRASIPAALAQAAAGDEAGSSEIASLQARSFVLSLAGQLEQASTIERCLAAMQGEVQGGQAGAQLMLSGLLRIVMVLALRISGGMPLATAPAGEGASVLVRFRQLVEINFRNRWPIARYAETLGVTPDRLHSLCTAGTGKPPKVLVSERMAQEAALRLEQSTVTIQRLAHSLGFGDQAHFSNFFRRMTGLSPNAYRSLRQQAAPREAETLVSFAEWP